VNPSLPNLPPDVDPALKRVPGMSIDFVDYQQRVQELNVLLARVPNHPGGVPTDAEVAEMVFRTEELQVHHDAYMAWLESRTRAIEARINRSAGLSVIAMLLIIFGIVVLLDYLGFPLRNW